MILPDLLTFQAVMPKVLSEGGDGVALLFEQEQMGTDYEPDRSPKERFSFPLHLSTLCSSTVWGTTYFPP